MVWSTVRMKKGYKKSAIIYSWDRPVERIHNEKGITLYENQQFDDSAKMTYPKYKYKVTFEYLGMERKRRKR